MVRTNQLPSRRDFWRIGQSGLGVEAQTVQGYGGGHPDIFVFILEGLGQGRDCAFGADLPQSLGHDKADVRVGLSRAAGQGRNDAAGLGTHLAEVIRGHYLDFPVGVGKGLGEGRDFALGGDSA